MKMNKIFAIGGVLAALFLGVTTVSAQNGGGGGGGGFGGGGRGNFDPAQFQQRMMDRIRTSLQFTNDSDWSAVQPLVQKVLDARRDLGGAGMGGFGRNRGGGGGGQNGGGGGGQNGGGRGGFFGTPSPEAQALQDAIDNDAPESQIKDLLTKYQASQKVKQEKFKAAQEALRAVLTVKQEASAALMGLVDSQ
jgi:hypothetical protein